MGELESVKNNVRSILINSGTGLFENQILEHFLELTGYELPYKDFGFVCARDFLNAMPDTCKPTGCGFTKYICVIDKNERVKNVTVQRKREKDSSKVDPNTQTSLLTSSEDFDSDELYVNSHTYRLTNSESPIANLLRYYDRFYGIHKSSLKEFLDFVCSVAEWIKASDKRINGKQTISENKEINKQIPFEIVQDRLLRVISDYPEGLKAESLASLYAERYKTKLPSDVCGREKLMEFLSSKRIFIIDEKDGYRVLLRPTTENVALKKTVLSGLDECFADVGASYKYEPAPSINSRFFCAVSYAVSPLNFFIHYETKFNEITDLFQKLQDFYSLGVSLPKLRIEQRLLPVPCALLHKDRWFRGLLQQLLLDKVIVKAVDIGAVCVVPITDVRPLLSSFMQMPAQAVRVKLFNVKDTHYLNSEECYCCFVDLVQDKVLECTCVNHDDGGISLVTLRSKSSETSWDVIAELL